MLEEEARAQSHSKGGEGLKALEKKSEGSKSLEEGSEGSKVLEEKAMA